MNKTNYFKSNKVFLISIVLLNIFLIYLRFSVSSFETFTGNIISTLIFISIVVGLLYFYFSRKYDYFIILWLSFYFACPIIVLPFTTIGSLGILNLIFIPLMILSIFNLKNKYFMIIAALLMFSILNLSDVSARILVSNIFLFLAPMIFFLFVLRKCKNLELIMWSSIFITIINTPIGIYEILFRPDWGVITDWRGFRIFGSLFWHNSYSFYLLPSILMLFAFFKETRKKIYLMLMIFLIILDIFTFSRNGLATLALSLMVFEWMYTKGWKITATKIVIFMVLIVGILLYSNNYSELNTHLQPETLSERTMIWESITPYMKDNLVVGNGIGSYELLRENFLKELSTHNFYLFIIFELGLIGLLLYLVFIFFIFTDLKKDIRIKKSFKYKVLGIALLVGIAFFSFFGNAAFSQVVSMNAWIILACCVKFDEEYTQEKK